LVGAVEKHIGLRGCKVDGAGHCAVGRKVVQQIVIC
jgi:hypothetical protein